MVMNTLVSGSLIFTSFCTAVVAQASLPPSFSVQYLGQTTEADSTYDGVTRDGGGGATINGNNLIVFSDTGTTKDGNLVGFTSNSIAYSSDSSATTLTDFGNNGVPDLGIPWLANETALTNEYMADGGRLIIWPQSSIAAMPDGVSGVAVYDVAHLYADGSATYLYNTMVQYQPTSSGPNASRLAPALFYPGEINYGSFGSAIAQGGKVLLFGKDAGGIKVARVSPSSVADRSQYQYWDGSEWTSTPVTPGDTTANIISTSISSGDFFYSPYLGTWVFIFFDGWADSKFFLSYSTSGKVKGPYSDQVELYVTMPSSNTTYNYAGHAYSGYDPTGRTVVLSWTFQGAYTEMAEVTFA